MAAGSATGWDVGSHGWGSTPALRLTEPPWCRDSRRPGTLPAGRRGGRSRHGRIATDSPSPRGYAWLLLSNGLYRPGP